jgi:alpha-N-arabinofuranosidase
MSKATLTVKTGETIGTISPLLHGHFAEHLGRCCYDGLWVGRDSKIPNMNGFRADLIEAFRKIGIPMLRWPGGCFADSYHWRDGIGAPGQRPKTVAESCGLRVVDTNAIGTHEFIELCRLIGAEPYLAGNVGSGSPGELCDWVTYCNDTAGTTLAEERARNGHSGSMNVRYWGVGNENWGCGGNYTAEDYAKEFRRYATFIKMTDASVDLVACGNNDRDWNTKLVETMRNHLNLLDHVSVHQYWAAGHSTDFGDDEYYQAMRGCELVEEDLAFTAEILDEYTAGRRKVGIAFDEWGMWHADACADSNYEAPSGLRDAVAGAAVLDVFHRWSDRVTMANIAQIVNVLHTPAQTHGEKMWLTPTYYLFALYAPHRGAAAVPIDIVDGPTRAMDAVEGTFPIIPIRAGTMPLISASASRKDGRLIVSMSNRHRDEPLEVTFNTPGMVFQGGVLSTLSGDAPNAVNTVDEPDRVSVTSEKIGWSGSSLTLVLPPCSVQTLELE